MRPIVDGATFRELRRAFAAIPRSEKNGRTKEFPVRRIKVALFGSDGHYGINSTALILGDRRRRKHIGDRALLSLASCDAGPAVGDIVAIVAPLAKSA